MLGSFIQSDVYRIMLGSKTRETLLAAIRDHRIGHDGSARAMRRDDGFEMWIAALFLDGEVLQKLVLRGDVQLMQVDNVSARLRSVPPLAESVGARPAARRNYGEAA